MLLLKTHEIKNVAIHAIYPESFCWKNAICKVFALSDSESHPSFDIVVALALKYILGPRRICSSITK